MEQLDPQTWKQELPAFQEKTAAFYAGEIDKAAYKAFSGYYGSYAQRGGNANMLRLRFPAGRIPKDKLASTARIIRKYRIPLVHFTTCQTIQLHHLGPDAVCGAMADAIGAGIVTMGGGGDYPRNVMCSPLSGVEPGEYFDVLPWAQAASDYLLHFIRAEKMPRKLKVGFSSSPRNLTHATYRDLGFAARTDGKFDVFSAGGLGNQPRLGVQVAEAVAPEEILYYIKAMWLTFRAYGNYENRARARTRFLQETLGGPENYVRAFCEKLAEARRTGGELTLSLRPAPLTKAGDGSTASGPRVTAQKQAGLYAVAWHPRGGLAAPETLCALSEAVQTVPAAELRLSPDQSVYIINLTGSEAQRILELTRDSARSLFETSVSCIGASICQIGVRDSQALLAACMDAVRAAGLPDGALPQIHISGCPSSCGTHQTGALGFRGAAKAVDGKPQPAYTLFINGEARQGSEALGRELGAMLETDIPRFLVALGRAVAASGLDFAAWNQSDPDAIPRIAAEYLK